MDSFLEALGRLKDTHEAEVRGLQNKLLELNSERSRDAQRVGELCAKNQQLREQQKALKENLRALENRLRAGLCDRCLVTQQLARKKQQEFESSLLQSLRHLFVLTNEMSRLQEENEALREEVKRLRGSGDRPGPPSREGVSGPPSPLLLPSPGAWKAVTEKPPGGQVEAQGHPAEKPAAPGPDPAVPPSASLPEPRASDMSPQRISNQLHGTIAVVRPGAWACPPDATPPLPAPRSSPASPALEHSLPLDSLLRAPRPPAGAAESLRLSVQADHLCLLHHHLSLKLRSPHGSPRPPAPSGPRAQALKARDTEAWEEPADLPGSQLDSRDPRLEGALHLLLAGQLQERLGSARPRALPTPGGAPPSPLACCGEEGPEGQAARAGLYCLGGAAAAGDCVRDKPLDLSERGRGRDAPKPAVRPVPCKPPAAHGRSPQPPPGAEPPALTPSSWALSGSVGGPRVPELEEPPAAKGPPQHPPGPRPSPPSLAGTGGESRRRPRPSPCPQGPEADGPPGRGLLDSGWQPGRACTPSSAEPPAADGQQLELDAADGEVGPSPPPSLPGEGPRCLCGQECGPGPQRKRKGAPEPRARASETLCPGKRDRREPPAAAQRPGSPREPTDGSHSLDSSSSEEA